MGFCKWVNVAMGWNYLGEGLLLMGITPLKYKALIFIPAKPAIKTLLLSRLQMNLAHEKKYQRDMGNGY